MAALIAEGGAAVGVIGLTISAVSGISQALGLRGSKHSSRHSRIRHAQAAEIARTQAQLVANQAGTKARARAFAEAALGRALPVYRTVLSASGPVVTRVGGPVYAQQPAPSYQIPDLISPVTRTIVGVARGIIDQRAAGREYEQQLRRAYRTEQRDQFLPEGYEYGTAPSEFGDEYFSGLNAPLIRGSLQDPRGRIKPRVQRSAFFERALRSWGV